MWVRVVSVALVSGCGVSASPKIEPPPRPAATTLTRPATVRAEPLPTAIEAPAQTAAELELPSECADPGAAICTPPHAFASAICKRRSVDAAIVLFGKRAPWTRAYVRADIEAWYTSARQTAPAELKLDEEVLILVNRSSASGGLLVGGGSYDVLRLDGHCVSLMADEVTLERPPSPTAATIAWRWLNDEIREALLGAPRIKAAYEQSRNLCRQDRSAAGCEAAARTLSLRIAEYLRGGGEVPLVLR